MVTSRRRRLYRSVGAVLEGYARGERRFENAKLEGADFSGLNLEGARFYGASLIGANFEGAYLLHSQFKNANVVDANFANAALISTDLIAANFERVNFSGVDFTGASIDMSNCMGADFRGARLNNADVCNAMLRRARFDGASLTSVNLCDTELWELCEAKDLHHEGPSDIDARAVMKSYQHPRLKAFMVDCGVPHLFAEYMIECARALGDSLTRRLMQSTYISYGTPDINFAKRLYDVLKQHGVVVFFFPETATFGERIDTEIYRRIHEHDRVILVCSESSLNRPGVLHEIQETFDREARDGGATYLLPIMLDDYVLTGWRQHHPVLSERVSRRVVGDFREALMNSDAFDASVSRLLDALKTDRPVV
ncbi:toll/interleukin-1 receptor domain-containing protein [Streptomyces griseoaurantiacus]|uniref:toll/interleukin-1 receptor domain-containing protein n=1 Tax=Streptomyces griseoaurantiacus TaxID=68213 RepID=UPI00352BE2D7